MTLMEGSLSSDINTSPITDYDIGRSSASDLVNREFTEELKHLIDELELK